MMRHLVLYVSFLALKKELLASSSFHHASHQPQSVVPQAAGKFVVASSYSPGSSSTTTSVLRGCALGALRVPFISPNADNVRVINSKKDGAATTTALEDPRRRGHRFDRTSDGTAQADVDIVLTIHGQQYNVTQWAKAHPGGIEALTKFRNRDATRAFEMAHHSDHARALLGRFAVVSCPVTKDPSLQNQTALTALSTEPPPETLRSRARRKLFTKEDPVGIHKFLGIFCLLHFVYRYVQMLFSDPSAGLGSHPGAAVATAAAAQEGGVNWIAPLCLLPHAALSLSSLIFHTVPKHRVVGKPMIWQEYRVHNIAFGVRSVVTALLCHLSIRMHHAPAWRRLSVVSTALAVLATQIVADWGTRQFRANENESTTATMPYWDGCSVQTQKRFKSFYAYCQFMATLACLAVMNPAWPLAVLLAIQGASLLMTLVRKGLLSARGYHYGYTFTLLVPYLVGFRSLLYTSRPEFLAMLAMGAAMYQLRCRGTNKYLLWIPVIAARVFVGDHFLSYDVW